MEQIGTFKLSPADNLVQIRWMIRRDMPEVMAIEKLNQETFWSEAKFLEHLRNRYCIGMVAEKFGRILGYMVYELHNGKVVLINIAVHPYWRRSRIGTQLLTKLKEKLIKSHRRKKLEAVVRDNNPSAHQFFQFNDMKAIVLPGHFKEFIPDDGVTRETDAYQFVYETNGEDDHVF
jgi:ribosomal-protein-alanine N-acetyltransferase